MSDIKAAKRRAIQWLARRAHSQHEIQQKLQQKGYDRTIAAEVVQYLHELGYLNDETFCQDYIRWRQNKGLGPVRIQQQLEMLGISAEVIAQQLDITDNAWFIAAQQVLNKQFKGKQPQSFPERAKQMRFLQYRGFTRDHIAYALNADIALDG